MVRVRKLEIWERPEYFMMGIFDLIGLSWQLSILKRLTTFFENTAWKTFLPL